MCAIGNMMVDVVSRKKDPKYRSIEVLCSLDHMTRMSTRYLYCVFRNLAAVSDQNLRDFSRQIQTVQTVHTCR
jgi:hypothetical protein